MRGKQKLLDTVCTLDSWHLGSWVPEGRLVTVRRVRARELGRASTRQGGSPGQPKA